CLRKELVNAHLRAQGIAVPDWAVVRAGDPLAWRRYPAIVKPAAEDASLGIDDRSVVRDGAALETARARAHQTWDRVRVQRFIGGRELNLAVVEDRVLPHAEIEWALPDGLPHVVTYAAKWDTGSVYDRGTVPRLLGPGEERLSARLSALARRVWRAVDGVGYGRIDVRMDERGRVWVIDVNPNPDLSPSAGLARDAMDPDQPRDTRRWFSRRSVADADFPSGRAVHTRVKDGRCVFLNGEGRCVLQKAARPGLPLKPFFCTAFPVTIAHGVLMLDDEDYRAGQPCCAATKGGPLTVFDTCGAELRHVLGAAGASRLRALAARTPSRARR